MEVEQSRRVWKRGEKEAEKKEVWKWRMWKRGEREAEKGEVWRWRRWDS